MTEIYCTNKYCDWHKIDHKIDRCTKPYIILTNEGMARSCWLDCVSFEKRNLTSRQSRAAGTCAFCDCVAIDEMGRCEGCGKLTRPPPA